LKESKKIKELLSINLFSVFRSNNVYDIESMEFERGNGIVLQCGKTDPQIYLALPHALEKPTSVPFCEVTYTNTVSGNLQLYWDYGDGLSEGNSTHCNIATSNKTESLLLPITDWKDGVKLSAFRIDPPNGTKFVLKSVKILESKNAVYIEKITNRKDVIQILLNIYNNKHYLEIGVSKGENFTAIKAKYKVGVDPIQPSELVKNAVNDKCVYHTMTSDTFFENEKNSGIEYDVIFVDGLHEYEQAYRDIVNSLELLAPDGVIVVHDCKPINEVMGLPPNMYKLVDQKTKQESNNAWMGDVWKAIVCIRSIHNNLCVFTLDFDCGCAIITRGKPESMLPYSLIEINAMNFDDFSGDCTRLLNLKDTNFFYTFFLKLITNLEPEKTC
jgi:hypothetical protein